MVPLIFLGNQGTARTFGRVLGMFYSYFQNIWLHGGWVPPGCLYKIGIAVEGDGHKVHDILREFFRLVFYQSAPFFHSQNVADIKKLKSVGICTVKGIQMTTRRALCNVKGLSEAKVDKIKEAANKLIVSKIHSLLF